MRCYSLPTLWWCAVGSDDDIGRAAADAVVAVVLLPKARMMVRRMVPFLMQQVLFRDGGAAPLSYVRMVACMVGGLPTTGHVVRRCVGAGVKRLCHHHTPHITP